MMTVIETMLSGFCQSALSVRFVIKRVYFLSVCVHRTDNVTIQSFVSTNSQINANMGDVTSLRKENGKLKKQLQEIQKGPGEISWCPN